MATRTRSWLTVAAATASGLAWIVLETAPWLRF
jgi:hypothetical protein